MRRDTWNHQHPKLEDFRAFRRIQDLHALTHACLEEVKALPEFNDSTGGIGGILKRLTKNVTPTEIERMSWTLDSLDRATQSTARILGDTSRDSGLGLSDVLTDLLDDTAIEDRLITIHHTAITIQSTVLRALAQSLGEEKRAALWNDLEQVAWKSGKRACEELSLPPHPERLLPFMEHGLLHGPVRSSTGPFLVVRETKRLLETELLACPHALSAYPLYAELTDTAGTLCHLHQEWARGFGYALAPEWTLTVTSPTHTPWHPCRHAWTPRASS